MIVHIDLLYFPQLISLYLWIYRSKFVYICICCPHELNFNQILLLIRSDRNPGFLLRRLYWQVLRIFLFGCSETEKQNRFKKSTLAIASVGWKGKFGLSTLHTHSYNGPSEASRRSWGVRSSAGRGRTRGPPSRRCGTGGSCCSRLARPTSGLGRRTPRRTLRATAAKDGWLEGR